MKAPLLFALLLALFPVCAPAESAPPSQPLSPGLLVTEYPRQDSQKGGAEQFYLSPDHFGQPIGDAYVTKSLNPWHWDTDRNAMASGYLEVPADGEYFFTSNNFYDRNILVVDDHVVCTYRDGDGTMGAVTLKEGLVKIASFGMVESRGASEGIQVRWKPPGQKELSSIPESLLWHPEDAAARKARLAASKPFANYLITAANDYIVEAYLNGVKIPDAKRKLLEERFGATVERIDVAVRPGDWLVFQVVHNRLRWDGSRYFAVAGLMEPNDFGFVSAPGSPAWSVCDDPIRSSEFILRRDLGSEHRAKTPAKPWAEGDGYMRQFAGAGFPGKALWGAASSTWIKYVAPKTPEKPVALQSSTPVPAPPIAAKPIAPKPVIKKSDPFLQQPAPMLTPKRCPVQILSATYGTGGKNADVTTAVKELVENQKKPFTVSPPDLGADPNPTWNKALHIIYMKDGVKREQHRNENEVVLPESFYGPQDPKELSAWLIRSRWIGAKGELQFNEDHTVTGSAVRDAPQWETTSNNKLRLSWPQDRKIEYEFDYVWGSFKGTDEAKETYHLIK